jgi:hypothetical protein
VVKRVDTSNIFSEVSAHSQNFLFTGNSVLLKNILSMYTSSLFVLISNIIVSSSVVSFTVIPDIEKIILSTSLFALTISNVSLPTDILYSG